MIALATAKDAGANQHKTDDRIETASTVAAVVKVIKFSGTTEGMRIRKEFSTPSSLLRKLRGAA